MTENQETILNYTKANGGSITKKEAIDLIGDRYYFNADKYVGEVLSRMVKAQFLIRIKPGVFKIGQVHLPNENQISLF